MSISFSGGRATLLLTTTPLKSQLKNTMKGMAGGNDVGNDGYNATV